ncbi:MAG: transposase [Limnoraphis sp. WC205]|nr:transposase [Limnoraphis sp. WC205]
MHCYGDIGFLGCPFDGCCAGTQDQLKGKLYNSYSTKLSTYKLTRLIDGIVEGINNKLKLLKRCGFGLRNFSNA